MTHHIASVKHDAGWGWTCTCGQERPRAKYREEGHALGAGRAHARKAVGPAVEALSGPCASCGAYENRPCTNPDGETRYSPHNGRGGYTI